MVIAVFKEYRKLKGYTQEQLAELSNIDSRTIQKVENEERLPNLISFARLVKVLNISKDDVEKYLQKVSELNNHKYKDNWVNKKRSLERLVI